MTPRRAAVLAANLPPGALTWAAVGDDRAWSNELHRLTDVFDVLQVANWQRGGDSKEPKPQPLDRPAALRAARNRIRSKAEAFKRRAAARRQLHEEQ